VTWQKRSQCDRFEGVLQSYTLSQANEQRTTRNATIVVIPCRRDVLWVWRGWKEVEEMLSNGVESLRLWLRWRLRRNMKEWYVSGSCLCGTKRDELRMLWNWSWANWVAATARAKWEQERDDKCDRRRETKRRDTETTRKLRTKRRRWGETVLCLFKLSTCRFYTEMSRSDPKARSNAKRRKNKRIKGRR
jgi:hypothetical protein